MVDGMTRKKWGKGLLSFVLILVLGITGCGVKKQADANGGTRETNQREIVIGFSQLGAESDWRSANTQSMKETFTLDKGYRLIVEDGQQQQANQIMAIRKFIQQDVDYIVLAPVTETGWDTVLEEAREAKIPVIIVDRKVDADSSLYQCWVGSDLNLEGKKAVEWLHQYIASKDIPDSEINIVDIQGTIGASAQIGRTNGLLEGVDKYGWNLLDMTVGDFTQANGREVMEDFLKKYNDINVVYCKNDTEALGAIEASGKTVGSDFAAGDIMVVSFDAVTKNTMRNILKDKISFAAGCNPHHGPRVEAVIQQLEAGKKPDKYSYVEERIYSHDATVPSLELNGNNYPVTVVTKETMEEFE